MKTPISQITHKVRQKLTASIGDASKFNDGILFAAVKAAIDTSTFEDKRFYHDEFTIFPVMAENSKEEQKLIVKTCLLFRLRLPLEVVEELEIQLYKLENGENYFMGR